MSQTRGAKPQVVTVRPTVAADLPRLLQIERSTPIPLWTLPNFQADLQSRDRINLVATINKQVVGFAVARTASEIGPTGARSVLARRCHLSLLHLAVAADSVRCGVARSLVRHLESYLRRPEDRIRAAVPETNLPVQLLLRSVGYRALRVLWEFYGSEDAYLMEWRR